MPPFKNGYHGSVATEGYLIHALAVTGSTLRWRHRHARPKGSGIWIVHPIVQHAVVRCCPAKNGLACSIRREIGCHRIPLSEHGSDPFSYFLLSAARDCNQDKGKPHNAPHSATSIHRQTFPKNYTGCQ